MARQALRSTDLKWLREALLGPATRTWWARGPAGEQVRVTEVAPTVVDAEAQLEVARSLAEATLRWGGEASPALSPLSGEGGLFRAACVLGGSGETLADRLRQGVLDPEEALDCVMQVAERLAAWHERGVAHGYVRPETLLFDGSRIVLLEPRLHAGAAEALLSRGALLPADAYAPPEADRFHFDSLPSDVFALGVLLIHLVAGRPIAVFPGSRLEDNPLFEALPGPLQRTVATALHPDPGQRLPGVQKLGLYLRVHRMWVDAWDWSPLVTPQTSAPDGTPPLPAATDPGENGRVPEACPLAGTVSAAPPVGRVAAPSKDVAAASREDGCRSGEGRSAATLPSVGVEPCPDSDADAPTTAATPPLPPDPPATGSWPSWFPRPVLPASGRSDAADASTAATSGPRAGSPTLSPEPGADHEGPGGPDALSSSPASAGTEESGCASPPGPLSIKDGWRGGVSDSRHPSPPLHPSLMERGPEGEAHTVTRTPPERPVPGAKWGIAAGEAASSMAEETLLPASPRGADTSWPSGAPSDVGASDAERTVALGPWRMRLDAPPPAGRRLVVDAQIGRLRERITVGGDRAEIGRPDARRDHHPDIDLRADDAVSRRHAEFRRRGDGWVLVDVGSTNGTRLNGRWLDPHHEAPLSDGDEIELGALTTLRVHIE